LGSWSRVFPADGALDPAGAKRSGTLSAALVDAGLAPEPVLEQQLPMPQQQQMAHAPEPVRLENADMLPRVLRDAAEAKAGTMPAWLKDVRRARWRSRLRNGMAWAATMAVVGGIIALTAALMGILPPAGTLITWM
jgi:hypothetical protein